MRREEGGGDGGERAQLWEGQRGREREAGRDGGRATPGVGKRNGQKRGVPPKGTSGKGEMRGKGVSGGRGGRRGPQEAKALRSKG